VARELSAHRVILPYPARDRLDWRRLTEEGIEVRFLKFVSPTYPQFWGDFIPSLSLLDLLLCLGGEGKKLLERSFTLLEP
jgi:hypothetical protein